jgi:hypothetical protein
LPLQSGGLSLFAISCQSDNPRLLLAIRAEAFTIRLRSTDDRLFGTETRLK